MVLPLHSFMELVACTQRRPEHLSVPLTENRCLTSVKRLFALPHVLRSLLSEDARAAH